MKESKTKATVRKKISIEKPVEHVLKKSSLPSIQSLVKDSWELFKKTILLYWKITVLGFIVLSVSVFLTILFAIPMVQNVIDAIHYPTVFEILTIIFFAVLTLIPLVAAVSLGFIWSIASTLILKGNHSGSIKSLITQSRPFIVPYFVTNLLVAFFILGGYFLLILPGIVISIFFLFVDYEIIFEKQKGIMALKRSYDLVKNNFWGILGRFFLIEIIIYAVQFILGKIAGQDGIMVFVTILINIAMGWFMQVYLYVLYKEAKERTTPLASSLTWMWVLASIGWVLLVIGFISLWHYLPSLMHLPFLPQSKIPPGTV